MQDLKYLAGRALGFTHLPNFKAFLAFQTAFSSQITREHGIE
jgi:hypothetical protein